ncbi:MAG: inositol monophosphatase [Nitrospirae bacterium GWD2_57_9]|nr:MAG: inositol monophosphatase [Nitrospirae bacterium GWD2_57_9]OGW46865.1 MAG: inositol monophosphatase [Nitrospirae bacterium GWC2_57_9]
MEQFAAVAREAARKAGAILRENINGVREITYKGDINLMTEMDMRSERAIVETLRAAFPKHGIIAEEETDLQNDSGFRWVIDPLDGTTNYAHGYPCFSVSIALEHRDEVIVGVVYDPMRDELFSAEQGSGALLNGRKIRVSSVDTLIKSLLSTGFPYDRKISEKNNMDYFHDLLMASQEVRRDGSAALDLCAVAAGRFDGFWELKLKPWDVAAGSLIVREAGGVISDLAGKPVRLDAGEILASNGRIHGQMVQVLSKAATNAAGGMPPAPALEGRLHGE